VTPLLFHLVPVVTTTMRARLAMLVMAQVLVWVNQSLVMIAIPALMILVILPPVALIP